MNAKARALGMKHTRYVEPTGLSLNNVSTARDLVQLLLESRKYPLLSQMSTTKERTITFVKPRYSLGFSNTNHLTRKSDWDIELTKTGFTDEAGHCLVMRTRMGNQRVAMVLLDAFGKYTHFADATRMRRWVETGKAARSPRRQGLSPAEGRGPSPADGRLAQLNQARQSSSLRSSFRP